MGKLTYIRLAFLTYRCSSTSRLNNQYDEFKVVFENVLSLAPVILKPGDRVLNSGTGASSPILLNQL